MVWYSGDNDNSDGRLVEELRVEESKVCRTVEDMLYRDHLGHRGFLGETCGYG